MVNVAKLKVPLIGLSGAGSGMALGTLAAEYTSRSTGQVGWNAFLVKGGVKTGIGVIAYLASGKIGDKNATTGFFVETLAYGCFGSIFMDLAVALYPGGIAGLAEDWSMTTRTLAAGGRKVVRELGTIEKQQSTRQGAPTLQTQVRGRSWF